MHLHLQYRIISKFYDLVDVFYFNCTKTNPRKGILDFISERKSKVLEVCIGTATNSIIIADNRINTEIVGIDLSKEMLALAKEKIEKRGIRNIETLVMDATNMNFDDNYFDVVLISLVLHEVDDNIRYEIMKESKRVLKNKGKIVVVEWAQPKKLIQKLLFLIIKLLEPKGFKEFLQLDIKKYVEKFSLKVLSEKKCDYTRIFEITKEE
ncbi:class I SAM-dependent methyltransferase [Clostridium sp. CF011]|uniref:class I SAM-dependent methyltransferase n=1 Tax=Clostridium sp. CF011 TaxID=2843318 RepID=UPI001C0CE1E2|nr:class I SAM-dependent methyltransferase [Clostridium sp. CF011]MBU3090841.1 class I SAM-dependent methyltransferase [Clostridium sp. CF011]WAG69614.1 class I SAM-dependent methyltransferase [Clostridium sp. CF011]